MSRLAFVGMSALLVLTACTSSKVKLGEDDAGTDAAMDAGGGEPCGDNVCGDGEWCCNASCGICAADGDGCIEIACPPDPVFCNGERCEFDTASCCPGCNPGESFCSGPGGECPLLDCPPPLVCADGTVCGGGEHCCPSAGCDDGYYCAPAGDPCVSLPVECPNECPDGTACAEGSQCCEGCYGAFFCSDGGLMCPIPSCPPPPVCGAAGEECLPPANCCSDCRGGEFCSDGPCPLCPEPGCDAQDAGGVGPCAAFFGYAWNGTACVGLSGCSCEGADCGSTFESMEECTSAYWSCMGPPPCSSDRDCEAGAYCDGCATSSCPFCDDCVAGCVSHSCMDDGPVTCRALRPECGDSGVAVVRDGCWQCVDLATCEPIDDCRATDCPGDMTCTACGVGEYVCLAPGMACAF